MQNAECRMREQRTRGGQRHGLCILHSAFCIGEGRALMAEAVGQLRVSPPPPELERIPLVANQRDIGWLSDKIAGVAEGKTPLWWWVAFVPSALLLLLLLTMITYLISTGVGVWGNNHPVMWGWPIINFV